MSIPADTPWLVTQSTRAATFRIHSMTVGVVHLAPNARSAGNEQDVEGRVVVEGVVGNDPQ